MPAGLGEIPISGLGETRAEGFDIGGNVVGGGEF
jgi:hypothetical protein